MMVIEVVIGDVTSTLKDRAGALCHTLAPVTMIGSNTWLLVETSLIILYT